MGTDKCSSTSAIVFCVFGTHSCQMTTEQNGASDNNAYATALMNREKHINLGVFILIIFTAKTMHVYSPLRLS